MKTLYYVAPACLAAAFCIGCGDSSSQSWERSKHGSSAEQSAVEKGNARLDDAADNGDVGGGESETPRPAPGPHGATNPHAGIEMTAGADTPLENNGKLDVAPVHFIVPKSWIRKSPAMPGFILAEYAIPKAEGDKEDGRLTVSEAHGSVEDNIARWKGQFDGKPEKQERETIDAGGVKITLVDMTGTFEDSRGMMMGPAVARPEYRMLGAIFQLPNEEGLHFVKCYGPKKTIAGQAEQFKQFLRSLKVDKNSGTN